MDVVIVPFNFLTHQINNVFAGKQPWQVATITATTLFSAIYFWELLCQDESLLSRTKKQFYHLIRYIPAVRRKIEHELAQFSESVENSVIKRTDGMKYFLKLPYDGLNESDILKLVDEYLAIGDYKWKNGRVSGAVYNYDEHLTKLVGAVYERTSYTNPMHSDIFPGINKMEAEVVRMCATMFNGDANTVGTMTTGGTESLIMACKAYRDYARYERGITKPNIVMPRSAHCALDKAAQYLNIHIIYVNLEPNTFVVDLKQMNKQINRNTIMLVGSAPNFPYGTMDNIPAIAALGRKYNIPVHVDACLGGFLIAFMKRAGYPIKPFDFSVNGVTSISVDPHKYGFTPKGCSVIIYSDKKFRNHQYTVTTDWPGGVYGSPTVNGSRAGGSIAACWATLLKVGEDGYIETTKAIIDTARYVERHMRNIKGIEILGTPSTSVIAFNSKEFEIFRLSDALSKLGWSLNILQFPSAIHICITFMHTKNGVADQFIKDVKNEVKEIMKKPKKPIEGKMAMYGVAQTLPDRSIVGEITRCFLDKMYYTPNS